MRYDGEQLYDRVLAAPGFDLQEDGDVVVLVSQDSGEQFTARTTTKGRYFVNRAGSPEPPVTWGASLGNGNLKSNLETQLARIGIETRPDRLQALATQARRQAKAAARPPETASTIDPAPEGAMPRAADEILSDIPTSIDYIAARVRDLAVEQQAERIADRGTYFYDWSGNLYDDVLRYLWPGLPEMPDAEDMGRILQELIPRMRRSMILRKQVEQSRDGADVWRVRDDDDKPATTGPVAAATPPEEASMSAPSAPAAPPVEAPVSIPPEPTAPEETTPPVKIYKCPMGCPFADPTEGPVLSHHNKFKARPEEHPADVEPIECPHCPAVRTTSLNYRSHLVDAHSDMYIKSHIMCQKLECIRAGTPWFETKQKYSTHLMEVHPEALRRTERPATAKPEVPETVPEMVEALPVPAAQSTAPSTALAVPAVSAVAVNGAAPADETPAQAAIRMLTEYPSQQAIIETLREENTLQRDKIAELTAENAKLRRTMKNFKKRLDGFFDE